jgi:phosphoglycolate phosphatase
VRLLFDLDGTLTDPGTGITRCIQHALSGLGRPVPSSRDLAGCVGPPLRDSFAALLGTEDAVVVERAIALYRQRFASVGMFENEVYPGVAAGLERLRAGRHELLVVTSKPHVYAREILAHFGLLPTFATVYGSELSGERADKASLLRHVLAVEGPREGSFMVGDRRHDVEGAHANGLEAVGVLWGYGSRAELEAAGADELVESMSELVEWTSRRARK